MIGAGFDAESLKIGPNKINNIVKGVEVAPFLAWNMGNVTTPCCYVGFLNRLFQPYLDNERVGLVWIHDPVNARFQAAVLEMNATGSCLAAARSPR